MHSGLGSSSAVAAANQALSSLQKVYEKYLQINCGVRRSTPVVILFAELEAFASKNWWEQFLKFWNKLAALPDDSPFHIVLKDHLVDAFQHHAHNIASAVADVLHTVGYEVPRALDVVPVIDVSVAGKGLDSRLQGSANHGL